MDIKKEEFIKLPILTPAQAAWNTMFLLPGEQSRQKDHAIIGQYYKVSARFNPHTLDVSTVQVKIK